MESLIIKPKDKAELNFFLELAKRLGARAETFEDDADERLFQAMEVKRVMSCLHCEWASMQYTKQIYKFL